MWAVKGHFRSEGKIPLGMRLISVLSMVGFAWFTWDFTCAVYAERQASTWANAAAWVLFLVDFTLFWWTVRVNAAHPLTLAFSIDQPSFLQQAGPYRFVRHPFYFSYVVFWIATAVASSNAVHMGDAHCNGCALPRSRTARGGEIRAVPVLGSLYVLPSPDWNADATALPDRSRRVITPSQVSLAEARRSNTALPAELGGLRAHEPDQSSWQGEVSKTAAQTTGLNVPSGIEGIDEEQTQTLGKTAYLFSALGVNTIALVLMDFRNQLGIWGWSLAAAIVIIYTYWIMRSLRLRQGRDHAAFLTVSHWVLCLLGILWGVLIAELAVVALPGQRNFVTALMMALVSVPMMGAPFSAAMAFWIPTVLAAGMTIATGIQSFEFFMTACFVGYVLFTFLGIVFINRTLLERSVGRVMLRQRNATIGLLLRDYEENAADWLWEADAELRLRKVTSRFAEVLRRPQDSLEGVRIWDLLSSTTSLQPGLERLASILAARQSFKDYAVKLDIEGDERWWSLSGRPVTAELGRFTRLLRGGFGHNRSNAVGGTSVASCDP